MAKKGSVLVMVFLVVVVIVILMTSFFLKTINENNLVTRFVNSTRAFWIAESGIAQAVASLPTTPISGTLDGNSNYAFSATSANFAGTNFYQINSTGSVTLPDGNVLSRSLTAIAESSPVDPNNFQHAIRTTSNLVVKGNVTINGDQEEFASINFTDLFGHTTDEMKSYADYLYTDPPVDIAPIEGITWVELSAGGELRISSNPWRGGTGDDGVIDESFPGDMAKPLNVDNGSILIVSGDAQITGGIYYGIIYVIGKLRMSGNPTIYGTILAESGADIDTTLTGSVVINYNQEAIVNALEPLGFIAPAIVSWKEN